MKVCVMRYVVSGTMAYDETYNRSVRNKVMDWMTESSRAKWVRDNRLKIDSVKSLDHHNYTAHHGLVVDLTDEQAIDYLLRFGVEPCVLS